MNQQLITPFPEIQDILPFFNMSSFNDDDDAMETSGDISASLSGKSKGLHVVLADDDADDRELFMEAIDESGPNVNLKMAKDGEDLLRLLNSAKDKLPDIIFLDLNMPNKGGIQCLQEIRNSPHLRDIPVVIYSTSSSIVDINKTYDHGANLYVSKPSSFRDLLAATRTVLTLDWEVYKPKASRKQFVYTNKK